MAQRQAGESPWSSVEPSALDLEQAAATDVPSPLLDDLEHAPVVLVVGVDLRGLASMDKDLDRVGIVSGASVYPFVWHPLLAARNDGYAGAITTFLVAQERDAQTLVGFPRKVAIAAMVPLGRPVKLLDEARASTRRRTSPSRPLRWSAPAAHAWRMSRHADDGS